MLSFTCIAKERADSSNNKKLLLFIQNISPILIHYDYFWEKNNNRPRLLFGKYGTFKMQIFIDLSGSLYA